MTTNSIIIGSRGSPLALVQSEAVRSQIERFFPNITVAIKMIETKGDKILDRAISKIGDKGLFTEELEKALITEEIDIAVHSLKDLPTESADGLEIAAYSLREESRDCLVSLKYSSLEDLPQGAKIGTSSLRRRSQLCAIRPDLKIVDLRGNVGTRIKKLATDGLDAIVLAAAGVIRLGLKDKISELIPSDKITPAPGQGIVAIQSKAGRRDLAQILAKINDKESAVMASAERELLRTFEGGCQVPIGAVALIKDGTLTLSAYVGSLDGKNAMRDRIAGKCEDAAELGRGLALKMISEGADRIIAEMRNVK